MTKPYLLEHLGQAAAVAVPVILHALLHVDGRTEATDEDLALAREIAQSYLEKIAAL